MKTGYRKDICTPIFIAVLLTIAKIENQPKYPSIDERINIQHIYTHIYILNVVCVYIYIHTHTHTHTMEYYSAMRRKKSLPFVTT